MSVDPATFRAVLGVAPSPVTVVSVAPEGRAPVGMTVSAFTAVSLVPPLVLVCIGHDATIRDDLLAATHLGVSVLASDQQGLSDRFADTDRRGFDGVPHLRGPHGSPLLTGAAAHLEVTVVARHPAGDHDIVVGRVDHAVASDREPLLHLRGDYRAPAG